MRSTNPMPVPYSTDSVVVLEQSPREEQLNNSYQLFLSSGQRTTAVEHGFLESWVHVVSTKHQSSVISSSPAVRQSMEMTPRTLTTTRCDKLARGRFLDKPSSITHHHQNPVSSAPTSSTDYRSFLAKLMLGVGGRMLSSSSSTPFSHHHQSSSSNNYSEKTAFFQAKSLMCGEFNNGDSTTVKIGNSFGESSSGSGEEITALANDTLAITSRKGGLRPAYGSLRKGVIRVSRTNTNNTSNHSNSNASLLLRSQQPQKKKTLRNRVSGALGFSSPSPTTSSHARKRLGARNQRIAVASTHNSNSNNNVPTNQVPSAVKHLGIFNFDAPTAVGSNIQSTIIINNHPSHSLHHHQHEASSSPRCNVVVKTVRSESTVEIQFWADLVADRARVYGKQHSLTRAASIELGSSHLKSGDHDEAAQIFQSILDNLHGAEKQSLVAARVLEKLGCALSSSSSAKACNGTTPKRSAEGAMECLNQALNIRCQLLGALHIDTIECLNHIAAQYLRLEDFSNAQRAYYEVLELRQAVFGKDISGLEHPSVAVAAQKLGQVYARLSEREKALEYLLFAEGIYISLKVPRDNHSLLSVQQALQTLR